MKKYELIADKNLMNISKIFYFKISIFFLLFILLSYIYAENQVHKFEETDEIDIEIMKYIKSLKGQRDLDEEKLNKIFGPPLTDDYNNDLSQKKNQEFIFNNISDKEIQEKINKEKVKNYIVKQGDTLYAIAKEHQMNLQDIFKLNPNLVDKPLYIGEVIKVYDVVQSKNTLGWSERQEVDFQETKYKVKKGDTLYSIAKKFNIDIKTLNNLNGFNNKTILKPNQVIIISKVKIIKNYKVRKLFIKPVEGEITSGFGYRRNPFISTLRHFHKGIDIGAEMGTPILSARDGIVIFSGRMEGFGNCIFIRHQEGYITIYGHNKVNYVKVGDIVRQGQVIGEVGRTGFATGPHLHFEVRKLDQPLNPIFALNLEEKIELSTRRIALK